MLQRKISKIYYLGTRHSKSSILLISLCLLLVRLLTLDSKPSEAVDLTHLHRSRDLHSYVDDILDPLIEPSSLACSQGQRLPLLVLVASLPSRVSQRAAIRETWGKELPTFFILGMEDGVEEQLVKNYMESKQHSDLVVFDFKDSQNQTLKTALMMRWSLRRCPQAEFVMKADDDLLVVPWTLGDVIRDHSEDKLIGHKSSEVSPDRAPSSQRFLPRWLYPPDTIPEYLSGAGYLINGEYLPKLVTQAYHEPLINQEDIYFTYLVARKGLNYPLTHDKRMNGFVPLLGQYCGYFKYATVSGVSAETMAKIWPGIKVLGEIYENGKDVCVWYNRIGSWFDWR